MQCCEECSNEIDTALCYHCSDCGALLCSIECFEDHKCDEGDY